MVAIGCRLGIPTVYVDESLVATERQATTNKIEIMLSSDEIELYNIFFVSKGVLSLHRIGSRITGNSGPSFASLGAFLKTRNGENDLFYILLSNHFAKILHNVGDTHLRISPNHDNIAELLPYTDGKYDVAAAELSSGSQNFDMRLKFRSGEPTLGSVFDSQTDKRRLPGLKVHIWGASTSPGFGKITVHDLSFKEDVPNRVYVIIEDDDKTTFSKKGDSGSIVCADDVRKQCVDAIAVLSGELTEREKATSRRQYIAAHLKACLKDLEERYGHPFTLAK